MRTSALLLLASSLVSSAQVRVDRPLQLTSTDSLQRQVEGLGAPVQEDALVTLGTARDGTLHWAQVSGTANSIALALDPPAGAYASGMLVRFVPALNSTGPVTLNADGLGVRKLLRPDLLPVSLGQLVQGSPVEAQYADSAFILLARDGSGCPPGYLYVNTHYCIQPNDVDNHSWFQAVNYCSERGARLCTWDEYYHACVLYSGSMTGIFDDWEWFDDTADHTHTAVQGGRWTCQSERSIGVVNEDHSTRCCYRLR